MVEPGFNSGSDRVYGIWEADEFGDMIKEQKGSINTCGKQSCKSS